MKSRAQSSYSKGRRAIDKKPDVNAEDIDKVSIITEDILKKFNEINNAELPPEGEEE